MSAYHSADLEHFDLNPAAIALLEFTSDARRNSAVSTEPIYTTSKDAFLWAGIAFSIAKSNLEALSSVPGSTGIMPDARRLEDIDILAMLYEAVGMWRRDVQESYHHLPQLQYAKKPDPNSTIEQQHFPYEVEFGRKEAACCSVMGRFMLSLRVKSFSSGLNVDDVNAAIRDGYAELIQKDLISDPIIEGGVAVLGFVPFSVTKKTGKGHAQHLRVRALLWSYERKRSQVGHTEVQLKWEVARIAKALKSGLASAFHEATKEGDDPDGPAT